MGKLIKKFKFNSKSLRLYVLILLCFLFGLSLIKSLKKVSQAKQRMENLRVKVEELKKEADKSQEELKIVQSDEFTQRQLRDKLGLVKEGEIVVILPEKDVVKRYAPDIPEEEDTLPDSIWKRWLKLFNS